METAIYFIILFLDFIVKISWQITCLIIFFLIRKPIINLIPKIKELSCEKGKWLLKFREESEKISKDLDIKTTKSDDNLLLFNYKNWSALIIDKWNELEKKAGTKLRQLNVKEKDNGFINKYQRPLRYLQSKGCFSPKINRAIDTIEMFRNDVVHFGYKNIKVQDIEKYITIIDKIIENVNSIQELPFTHLHGVTMVMFELIYLIDTGEHNSITLKEVKEHIENENVLQFIISLNERSDISCIISENLYDNFEKYYNKYLKSLCQAYSGNERRKWGIENSGLCLLLAWTNQMIAQGSGWYPDMDISCLDE